MATLEAQSDFTFSESMFTYGGTVTSDPFLFSFTSLNNNFRIEMTAPFGEAFSYATFFGVGTVPVSGTATSITIIDNNTSTTLATITGTSLAAAGNLDKAFIGSDIVDQLFNGDDDFRGQTFANRLTGDFDLLDSGGTHTGGDDTFLDSSLATSATIAGDAFTLGNTSGDGGTLNGGDDDILTNALTATIYGDTESAARGVLIGGNDTVRALADVKNAAVYGDSGSIGGLGVSTPSRGGNDTIDFGLAQGAVAGDMYKLVGDFGTNSQLSIGGNDTIIASTFTATRNLLVGDADINTTGGTLFGGADTLTGNGSDAVIGDVRDNAGSTIGGVDGFIATIANDFYVGDVLINRASGVVTGGDDILHGGNGNDILVGDVDDNEGILWRGGDDTLNGGDGNDELYGDTRTPTGGSGGGGTIITGGANTLNGGAGNDSLFGGIGNDTIDGGADIDTLFLTRATGDTTVQMTGSGIGIASGSGIGGDNFRNIESFFGGDFSDYFIGDETESNFRGGDGDDIFQGGGGDDTLQGELGIDEIRFLDAGGGVTFTLGAGGNGTVTIAGLGTDTYTSMENIVGGAFGDTLTGNSGHNLINGFTGADTLTGAAGNDTLVGDSGNDTLHGDAGNDKLNGGAGVDNDVLDGGADVDTADYSDATSDTTVILLNRNGIAQSTISSGRDTLTSIENLIGSNFNDKLIGDVATNIIRGGEGNDNIDGAGGDDMLFGEDGNDGFRPRGANVETFDGGNDTDSVNYSASTGVNAFLDGSGTNGRSAVNDTFVSIENLIGSDIGGDLLYGDAGANRLTGLGGADTLRGRAGIDQLEGGDGGDTFIGDEGADVIVTGIGSDTVVFNLAPNATERDRITDFTSGQDTLQIDASVFGGGLVAGAAVQLVSGAGPVATNGIATFLYDNAGSGAGFLYFDADGTGAGSAELFAWLQNVPILLATDFDVMA